MSVYLHVIVYECGCIYFCVSVFVYLHVCMLLFVGGCVLVCVLSPYLCVHVCLFVLSACLSMLCELYVCSCVYVYLFIYVSFCLSGYVAGRSVRRDNHEDCEYLGSQGHQRVAGSSTALP